MKLEDSIKKIDELLFDFHKLTGSKICLYDADENEIDFFPEKLTQYCEKIRFDLKMNDKCAECDRSAFAECKRTHKPSIHTCHAGLIECFAPIIYNDIIIGFIVIGQMREEGKEYSLPFKDDDLISKYYALPSLEKEKIGSSIRVLCALTGYEYLRSILDEMNTNLSTRIAEYIEDNLTSDLSVDKLEEVFNISRRNIYAVFKREYDSSVAEYVKKRRLEKSRVLLKTTPDTVTLIAEKCGFSDYNYFSKQFKKEYNTTPREYRREK